jgi:hypothetical protein
VTEQRALEMLEKRADWLIRRIGELEAQGRPTNGLRCDRGANEVALAAVKFVIATQEYEQSKS